MSERKEQIPGFSAGGAVCRLVERFVEIVIIIPITMLAGADSALLAPVMVMYQIVFDAACAGVPFGIAMIISHYSRRKKYKNVMAVFHDTAIAGFVIGAILASVLMIAATPLSTWILGSGAASSDISAMTAVLRCFALFAVSEGMLAGFRSVDQGMKRHNDYMRGVLAEQGLRLIGAILLAWLCVKKLQKPSSYAIMMYALAGVLASAIVLAYYIRRSNGLGMRTNPVDESRIQKQILHASRPYLSQVILSSLWILFDLFVSGYVGVHYGISTADIKAAQGIIFVQGYVLCALPMLLSCYDCFTRLPQIEEAFENGDGDRIEQHVNRAFASFLIVAMPLGTFALLHSDAIVKALFPSIYSAYAASIFRWSGPFAILFGMGILCMHLLSALQLQKQLGAYQLTAFIIKDALLFPMVKKWGMKGILLSSILYFAILVFLSLARIRTRALVEYRNTGIVLLKSLAGCLSLHGAMYLLSLAGIDAGSADTGILKQFVLMLAAGAAAYYMTGDVLRLFPKRRKRQ
ncbi:MAG: hypothetical protein SOI44_02665 [Lactimicrobium sp.]|jgi:O-antigen/teichoic acid export membrane protein|uniref:hypothetical protein n=1 Tax=Lactimicrobium sp. TaxID=2563780 RepID=UPI002F355DB0